MLWSSFLLEIFINELFEQINILHKINMLKIENTYVWVPPIKQQDGGPYTGPLVNFTTIAHCCEILFLTKSEDCCSRWYTVSQYHLSFSPNSKSREFSSDFFFSVFRTILRKTDKENCLYWISPKIRRMLSSKRELSVMICFDLCLYHSMSKSLKY